MAKKQIDVYDVHTMQATPDMRVGMRKLGDGSAKIIIELDVKEVPKTVGEVLAIFRERLVK